MHPHARNLALTADQKDAVRYPPKFWHLVYLSAISRAILPGADRFLAQICGSPPLLGTGVRASRHILLGFCAFGMSSSSLATKF